MFLYAETTVFVIVESIKNAPKLARKLNTVKFIYTYLMIK